VEAALRDEAVRAVAELPPLVKDVEPIVRLQSFSEAALQFNLIFRVRDYDSQYEVWGELHQRLLSRLGREGFEPALPVRTVYLHGEPPPPDRDRWSSSPNPL
jgi:small-conductance mechanosensitive channel